jgi:hypothetical protein
MPEVYLPLERPEELSDEAVAQLVECLGVCKRRADTGFYRHG